MADIEVLETIDVAKPEPEDLRMYSVTTIIGALDKPALLWWAAQETAKAAVNQAGYLAKRVDTEGVDAVVKDLSGARFKTPKGQRTAADLGTAVHDALEQLALTGVFPDVDDEVRPFIEQADRWMQKFQPTYIAAEMTTYSPTYGYAGTLDAIFEVDGVRFLVDYKTSRKSFDARGKPTSPYPESVGIQLAAYRYAEYAATWRPRRYEYMRRRYYLLGMDERETAVPVPEVDTALVLHLTPEHCVAFPINADKVAHDAFLYVLESFRWVNQISKTVMGAPLEKD
jgi:ATP-dependent exoDNAse (exonuclease V) beta subunit